MRFIYFYFILIFQISVLGAEVNNSSASYKVKWLKLDIKEIGQTGRVLVTLYGETQPDTQITLAGEQIVFFTENGDFKTKDSRLVLFVDQISDDKGQFSVEMNLPALNSQIAFQFKFSDSVKKIFQINLLAQKKKIEELNQSTEIEVKVPTEKKWALWLGYALAQISYTQQTDIPSDLEIATKNISQLSLELSKKLNTNLKLINYLSLQSGQSENESNALLTSNDLKWVNYTLETNYSADTYALNFGLRYNSYPFIRRSSPTDSTSTAIEPLNFILGFVGANINYTFNERWSLTGLVHTFYPIYKSIEFKLEPQFSYETKWGFEYEFVQNFRVGLLASYEEQKFKLSELEDIYFKNNNGPLISGTQTVNITSLEVRLGYLW